MSDETMCKCGHLVSEHDIDVGCLTPIHPTNKNGYRSICPCGAVPSDVFTAEIERLTANLSEWQRVGEIIQLAATGNPGQLSDSDVVGEIERLRAALIRIEANPWFPDFHVMMPGEMTDKEIARAALSLGGDK